MDKVVALIAGLFAIAIFGSNDSEHELEESSSDCRGESGGSGSGKSHRLYPQPHPAELTSGAGSGEQLPPSPPKPEPTKETPAEIPPENVKE